MYATCPKCGHSPPRGAAAAESCPACGIIFAKWLKRQLGATPASPAAGRDSGKSTHLLTGAIALLADRAFHIEDRVNPFYFAGRALVFAGLLAWGAWFISLDFTVDPYAIGSSWMHRINLVFHEAGHLIFSPFGFFITILGGTLGQLIMPLVVTAAFLFRHNPFGAAVGLWWLGQSFMDCAPYIDDALDQKLVLLGGHTGRDAPGNHDWNNLLADLNMLERAREFATLADTTGTLLMLAAFAWGGTLLWRQWRRVDW